MCRVCYEKATGKIIESQSGGSTPEHLQTLIDNAVKAGWDAKALTCVFMSEEDYYIFSGGPAKEAEKAEMEGKIFASIAGMKSLPGWATWTATQAEDWIEGNVTSLATAKTALKALAKAVIYLRDHSQITK